MKNRLQKLRLPLLVAPMFLVSNPSMVIEASKAGVIGSFPSPNTRSVDEFDHWMNEISQALSDPEALYPEPLWATNLVTHSSNLRLKDDLSIISKYKPPIVITALGSPKPVVDIVHDYGGIVIADVINPELAYKASNAGVDGLACICNGAGGHTGYLSPFAFISSVREFFDGYIAVGGGIADGWSLLGAIAAGADFAYMGTRFIACRESMADERYKNMIVQSEIKDLIVSDSITGTSASWLIPSLIENGYDPLNLPPPPDRNYSGSNDLRSQRWSKIWAAGQGIGKTKSIQRIAEIIHDIEIDFMSAKNHIHHI